MRRLHEFLSRPIERGLRIVRIGGKVFEDRCLLVGRGLVTDRPVLQETGHRRQDPVPKDQLTR